MVRFQYYYITIWGLADGYGDSIQLYTSHNSIKTFAKKDIIENKPMNERKFSIMTAPDSLDVTQMIKLPNGSAFATLGYKYGRSELQKKYTINNKSVVIFNDDKVDSYEIIKYDSFDVKSDDSSIDSEDIIKNAYAGGCREIKENNMVVCSVNRQFILYTFDPSSGNVLNERRYTKLQSGAESGNAIIITNDQKMEITYMKSNDQYIYCVVKGYFSKKDRELEQRKWKLFVFDWDLNPIKRFDLPNEKKNEYIISHDGKSIYIGKHNNDGIALSKADIDI